MAKATLRRKTERRLKFKKKNGKKMKRMGRHDQQVGTYTWIMSNPV